MRVVALLGDERARHAFADELMLRRALSNLLDNAIKFSQPGQRVLVALRPGAQCWQLQVRDAGPGIAADQHDGVFQEFVQLDNQARDRQQGYGLGLAISRRFARLMLGSLTLRSAPGAGSCFTLALPRASAPCAPVLDDAAQDKSTYVALLGLEEARQRANVLFESARKSAGTFGEQGAALKALAEHIQRRDH